MKNTRFFTERKCRNGFITLLCAIAAVAIIDNVKAGGMKPPSRIVAWNGERRDNGAGWSTPNTEDIYLKMQSQVARSGHNALEWHVTAKEQWTECGWEWLGWWPPTRGTDISSSSRLTFWIRVLGAHRPSNLQVSLKSSNQKRQLPTVDIAKYDAKFADGNWHRIKIPLRDMFIRTQGFDTTKASQIFLGTWNAQADFSVYLDDIVFE